MFLVSVFGVSREGALTPENKGDNFGIFYYTGTGKNVRQVMCENGRSFGKGAGLKKKSRTTDLENVNQ